MTSLTQQLQQLKIQQEELEKRIRDEKLMKQKLNKRASIDRLDELIKPLTNFLEYKHIRGHTGGNPIYAISRRKQLQQRYDLEVIKYNEMLSRRPSISNRHLPLKDNNLLNEEIFITIIGILKKQDKKIKELENVLKMK